MEAVVERCAGIDISKADLKACIRTPGPRGGRRHEVRTFATTLTGSTPPIPSGVGHALVAPAAR